MKKVILFPLLMFAVCSSILAQNALEPAVYGNYANDSKDALDQYYNEKRTKLLHLNRLSCGVYVNQSFRQEGVLGYDSVKHVLVYNESIKNIWSQAYRERMEPGAASLQDRLSGLRLLSEAGSKTWVSMEPYPTPNLIEQDLGTLLEAVSFTDKIIFGRTNYSKEVNAYELHKQFYKGCAQQVIDFCEQQRNAYHIKEKTISE